jgi:hypothetical protein
MCDVAGSLDQTEAVKLLQMRRCKPAQLGTVAVEEPHTVIQPFAAAAFTQDGKCAKRAG